ncbi:MAG: ribosome maturation factor RimM [Pseudomonadales bacterium]
MTEIRLGTLTGGHGIKGWIKVFSHTDPKQAIFDYSPWILRRGRDELRVTPAGSQVHGKKLIVQFEGVDTRTQADEMAGYVVNVEQTALPALEDGDYYWHQLTGLTVVNMKGECLGSVDHLLETGANDVLVVEATAGSIDDEKRLIPFVLGPIVQNVDLAVGEILVDWDCDY